MTIKIEPAVPEDAAAIFDVQRLTWFATYPNAEAGLTEENLRLRIEGENGKSIPEKIERWRKIIAEGIRTVFVARISGRVVGFVAPGIMDGQRRIGALYVLPEAQGKGLGSQLLQKALEWHGKDQDIYLRAASFNHKAINFYKHFGFEQTDAVVTDDGDVHGNTRISEIEMVLKAK